MGCTIFLSAQVRLRPDVPRWALEYLRGLVEGAGEGHEAQMPPGIEAWWNFLPGGGWFGAMSTDGSLQALSGPPGEWSFRLQGEFHDTGALPPGPKPVAGRGADLDLAAVRGRLSGAGDDTEALARAVAEAAVEAVLGVLDAGFDQRAAPDSPGWEIAETSRPITFGAGRTIRTIRGLPAMIDDLPGCDVSAGPTRLVAGLRVRVQEPLSMTAGSEVWVDAPGGGKTYHALPLVVPAGAELTVTLVYPRGHAECSSPHWPSWIVDPPPGTAAARYPTTPQPAPDRYRLSWIRPEFEGRDYVVIDDGKPDL